jgi:hypothetical protein
VVRLAGSVVTWGGARERWAVTLPPMQRLSYQRETWTQNQLPNRESVEPGNLKILQV